MLSVQAGFFDDAPVQASIPGLVYQPEFLTANEEREVLNIVRGLPLEAAKYKEYLARRRTVSYGGSYDFDTNTLKPSNPLDKRLEPLRARVAAWLNVDADTLVHALVSEYEPGTPLGWHRDVPDFETICGVSLGGHATLKFRPYPYEPNLASRVVQLEAQPRSIYRIAGEARWRWQHSVNPTPEHRWSITFRTKAARSMPTRNFRFAARNG